ncbi:flagellar biosynthetic protein FliR [Geothrix sp. PMB-07]|uniref:flagellar biosynthetic protein FliR n=1 Tax=Geothrix sp. PMB-07 TaxID=3068640 RepID=UPI002740771E|nr:flagellar biosynthetic protein FliR [Geothrix sp. PMB-07]WLT33301.1 flagellar biosynthetic protein FliR [Geothrix sp. PMB-07]
MTPTLSSSALWAFTGAKAALWVLVLTRLTGLLAAFPILGGEQMPLPIRAALGALLATVILPVIPVPPVLPSGLPELVGLMASELAIGLLLGTVVAWTLEAVSFAGTLMDTQMGFSFVQFIDPATSQSASISGSLMTQVAALLVFVTGLHHQMILALVDSYRVAPMGQGVPLQVMGLIVLIGQLLAKGFQLAFPVLAVLFLLDLTLGISGKFMPQLQLLQLSFPLKISLGLLILGLVLRELGPWLVPLLDVAPRLALKLLGG